jgi:hypothetical protein
VDVTAKCVAMFSLVHLPQILTFSYSLVMETKEKLMPIFTKSLKAQIKKRRKDLNEGLLVQAAKEVSSIPAYAMRELTGQSHREKPRCKLKKGWFE